MISHPLVQKLIDVPSLPGCYIYRDENDKILYIGKAKNLKKRVSSYFANYDNLEGRIQIMIDRARKIDTHTVDSEIEALILEANLIRKYKPPYNADLKDDKKYAWIKITTKDEFPAVYKTREYKDDGNKYFGPYPSGVMRDSLLKFLRKQFPFRTCQLSITEEKNKKFLEAKRSAIEDGTKPPRSRLCMFYHLGLCSGPCDGLVSKPDYRSNVNNISRFLAGNKKDIYDNLKKEMNQASKNQKYEQAAKLRDQMRNLEYFMQKVRVEYGDDEYIVKEINDERSFEGLVELVTALNKKITAIKSNNEQISDINSVQDKKEPFTESTNYPILQENGFRIECYDISNISGKYAVGSMIVFENGVSKKSDYRKFKIREIDSPNDYKMMMEVLGRRLKYLTQPEEHKKNSSFNAKPDLIIIDGGKGQLSSAKRVIDELGLDIIVVGLAKRNEEIFMPEDSRPIVFADNSQTKFLIQRVRDEAHRFAITYHRKLRSKGMIQEKNKKLFSKAHEKQWK